MIKKFNVEKTKQLKRINKILSLFYRKPGQGEDIDLPLVRNILIVNFSLIGDMIMDIPFLKTLRHNCPDAKITMVCMPWAVDVLGDQDLIDDMIVFNGKDMLGSPKLFFMNFHTIIKTIKKINKKEYDIGFEPKGDLRHILFLHYTNCKKTISYNYTGGEYLITDCFEPKKETKHLIDEKLDLLRMSGFTIYEEDSIPRLELSETSQQLVTEFIKKNKLHEKRIIGIHPGASNINKQYRFYPELINEIVSIEHKDILFLVFEGPREKEIVDKVENSIIEQGRQYIRIKRNIKDYVSLVSVCDYMICNDSAAGHIAAAYGIPTIVIFGAVRKETALPKGRGMVIGVSHDLECKPCTLPTCPLGTEECIQSIRTDEVVDAYKRLTRKEGICS